MSGFYGVKAVIDVRQPEPHERQMKCNGCNAPTVVAVLEVGNDRSTTLFRMCWECSRLLRETARYSVAFSDGGYEPSFPIPRPDGFIPTQEQSADIKAALDYADAPQAALIEAHYPLEWDEWNAEADSGQRQRLYPVAWDEIRGEWVRSAR